MPSQLLRITRPDTWWCTSLVERYPRLKKRILSVVPVNDGRAVEVVELRGEDARDAAQWLESSPSVDAASVRSYGPGCALVYVEAPACPLVQAMRETAQVPTTPFDLEGKEDEWVVAGAKGDDTFRQRLRSMDVPVVQLGAKPNLGMPRLTPHQDRTLRAAVEAGYYSHPRRVSLTHLAERLGIAKSTLSETLMVIEHKVVKGHLQDNHRSQRD